MYESGCLERWWMESVDRMMAIVSEGSRIWVGWLRREWRSETTLIKVRRTHCRQLPMVPAPRPNAVVDRDDEASMA